MPFMECSSHAIHQHRIGGLHFEGALFTNLTRDHLDYHGTFENYRNAKKMFFDDLSKSSFAVTNADDKNGMVMVQTAQATSKPTAHAQRPTSKVVSSRRASRECCSKSTGEK